MGFRCRSGRFDPRDRAIELDPQCTWGFCRRADVREIKGDRNGADSDLKKALELDPKGALPMAFSGLIHFRRGQWEQAAAQFSRAIEIDPEYGYAYLRRGWARFAARDFAGALADFRKCIELDPAGTEYERMYVWILRTRSGEAEPALAELKKGHQELKAGWIDPWGEKVAAMRALLLSGDKAKAKELFQKCTDCGARHFIEHSLAVAEIKALE
jgi:tetratricopeptide (TPR) repeat protein